MTMNKSTISYASLVGEELGEDFLSIFSEGQMCLTVRTLAVGVISTKAGREALCLEVLTEEFNLTPFIFCKPLSGSNFPHCGSLTKSASTQLSTESINAMFGFCEKLASQIPASVAHDGRSIKKYLTLPLDDDFKISLIPSWDSDYASVLALGL